MHMKAASDAAGAMQNIIVQSSHLPHVRFVYSASARHTTAITMLKPVRVLPFSIRQPEVDLHATARKAPATAYNVRTSSRDTNVGPVLSAPSTAVSPGDDIVVARTSSAW